MPFTVTFRKSNITAAWNGSHGSLLDLAEAHGIDIPFSCRSGIDNVCQTPLLSGTVEHPEPLASPDDGHCLPCIAIPTSDVVLDA